MRRILVEIARRKLGPRRGGERARVEFSNDLAADIGRADEIVHVHEALESLAFEHPTAAELVKLRYFAGLSHGDAANALGISRSTADRQWAFAKAFLFAALKDGSESN
jgi:DNA-directed RNA polymerase specialized sigma24 family protein